MKTTISVDPISMPWPYEGKVALLPPYEMEPEPEEWDGDVSWVDSFEHPKDGYSVVLGKLRLVDDRLVQISCICRQLKFAFNIPVEEMLRYITEGYLTVMVRF